MALVYQHLWVKPGFLKLGGEKVPFWGFAKTRNGIPTLPGPLIEVNAGDFVYVTLHNREIPEPVSIMFPGQRNVWVRADSGWWEQASPQYEDGKITSLTNSLPPHSDAWLGYLVFPAQPGIYLYESGTRPEVQVQMGLYGVMAVRPRGDDRHSRKQCVPPPDQEASLEKILVIGEIDAPMHYTQTRCNEDKPFDYPHHYWTLNGRCYPDTVRKSCRRNLPYQPYGSCIVATVGQRVLLRVINAGFQPHTLHLGGLVGRVVAEDNFPLVSETGNASYQKTDVTLGSGQSFDISLAPEHPGEYYLYAREYQHLVNADEFPGGIMTKIRVLA